MKAFRSFYNFVHFSWSLFLFLFNLFFHFAYQSQFPLPPVLPLFPTFPPPTHPPSTSQKGLGLPWGVYTVWYNKLRQNQAPLCYITAKQGTLLREWAPRRQFMLSSLSLNFVKIKSHHFSSFTSLMLLLSSLSYAFPSTLKLVASFFIIVIDDQ